MTNLKTMKVFAPMKKFQVRGEENSFSMRQLIYWASGQDEPGAIASANYSIKTNYASRNADGADF